MASQRQIQIIETAASLIKQNGFENTSMRDLAAALKIEASSLYNHISSKDEILKAICFEIASEFIKSIYEVNDIYFDAEQKLRLAIESHVMLLTQQTDKAYVFVNEWKKLKNGDLKEFIALRDVYEKGFETIVQNGEDEGLFNEVDKKFAVLTILSSLNWVVEWYRPDGNMSAKQIAEKLTSFILTGLKKEKL